MVELLGVVVHGSSSLLEVHELLAFLPHHAGGDVVGAEGIAELNPQHLVIRGASDGVVSPPRASVTPQLLRGEEVFYTSVQRKSPTPSPEASGQPQEALLPR
jgi:hypothetical protein